MKYTFFATQVEINIIFIPYLLPSIALSKYVLGPPDQESLLVLFWSHFKSAIKIFTLKKRVSIMFHGLNGGWFCETGVSLPVKKLCWSFQGGTSFVDHLCYFCLVFVMLSRASVY